MSHQPQQDPQELARNSASDAQRHEQFVKLFAAQNHRVYAFIRTLIPNSADADEVFQRTSLVLWRKFADFQPDTDFVRWACQIAKFEALSLRRTLRRDRLIFDESLMESIASERLDREPELSDYYAALLECEQKLSVSEHELVNRCYASGAKINAVAQSLGRPVNSVYKALARIRRKLYECVQRSLAKDGVS